MLQIQERYSVNRSAALEFMARVWDATPAKQRDAMVLKPVDSASN